MLSGPSTLVAETKSLTRDNLGEEGPILAQSLKEVSPWWSGRQRGRRQLSSGNSRQEVGLLSIPKARLQWSASCSEVQSPKDTRVFQISTISWRPSVCGVSQGFSEGRCPYHCSNCSETLLLWFSLSVARIEENLLHHLQDVREIFAIG